MNTPEFRKAGRLSVDAPKTYLRQYLGFIAPLVVLVPCLIAGIHKAYFYRGCMDGFGLVISAGCGFVLGGLMNLVFLIYVFSARRQYFEFGRSRDREIAKIGVILSILLIPAQIIIFFSWCM
jgi:uncharacterized membrane protein